MYFLLIELLYIVFQMLVFSIQDKELCQKREGCFFIRFYRSKALLAMIFTKFSGRPLMVRL